MVLTLPFRPGTRIRITEGWCYSTQEKKIHGITKHGGVDFAAVYGTPVVASIGGYAIGTYEVHQLTGRTYKGKTIDYGYGRVVLVWTPKYHVVTIYAHLSKIEPKLHYFKPESIEGIWRANALNWSPTQLASAGTRVKRGELLGLTGVSGLGLGFRESPKRQPTPAQSWDEPHLHLEVYVHGFEVDPFDVYSTFGKYRSLRQGKRGLWLTGPDGRPQFP
jgi:murein DD-endopeptidase MepM/ murein hydrolase activator NlpD